MRNLNSRAWAKVDWRRWRAVRRRVFERDGWRCVKCKRPGRLECDHIRPLAQGGRKYDLGNLQALCRGCHIRKTARENDAAAARLYPQQAA